MERVGHNCKAAMLEELASRSCSDSVTGHSTTIADLLAHKEAEARRRCSKDGDDRLTRMHARLPATT